MERAISQLIEYAVQKEWISEEDRVWASNLVLDAIGAEGFGGLIEVEELPPIQEVLDRLCDIAAANGVIDGESVTYRDLLDTKLMGLVMPRPSEVIKAFHREYLLTPRGATEWYYGFSGDTNYIRRDRIAKDERWTVETDYGTLDISINLSKPEKDPKAIAAAGKAKSTEYPKCLLCMENEGYAGHLRHPARQNHRIIPINLDGKDFFLQYSPYVYYNEHCIVFNKEHIPMHIDRQAFTNLLDFVELFPHYFIGSNADLPIVGGSVLSHDHYQGGRFEFAMERAQVEEEFVIRKFEDVRAGIVKWPMSVIRISGKDRTRLKECAGHILDTWRQYDDPEALVFHETDGELHNTITPIARAKGEAYELDLVLRNNRTTDEYPLGIFHPHQEKHHIKKENIGLIEVMGLAILPARLKKELAAVADALLAGKTESEMEADPFTSSHAKWAAEVASKHPELDSGNAVAILREEVGHVFAAVLEDAGVFKRDAGGKEAFRRFVRSL